MHMMLLFQSNYDDLEFSLIYHVIMNSFLLESPQYYPRMIPCSISLDLTLDLYRSYIQAPNLQSKLS